jgi:hypothetical protein
MVPVPELEAAARIARERGGGDREHRRDAAAGGECREPLRAARRIGMEAPVRRHHVDARTGDRRARDLLRHASAGLDPDTDGERIRAFRIDDRVGPPFFAPADVAAQHHVLAGVEPESLAQFRRQREGHRDRVLGGRRAPRDRERVEFQHGRGARCT